MKTAACIVLLTLRLFYQPDGTRHAYSPFTSQPATSSHITYPSPVSMLEFTGTIRDEKAILHWVISDNESAYLFEVERSTNGRDYQLAGIVFSSDDLSNATYSFREKAGNSLCSYRLKMVQKDHTAAYSSVVKLGPGV